MLSLVEFIQEKIFAPFDIQIMKRSFFLDNYTPVKNISTLDLRQDNAIDPAFFQVVTSHSLTSKMLHNSQQMLAAFTVYSALKYIVENEKRGDLVECGVFDGNKILLMAEYLSQQGKYDYDFYLYDTFSGMTNPSQHDRALSLEPPYYYTKERVQERFSKDQKEQYNNWCYCSEADVRENVLATSYPTNRFNFIKGDVRQTLLRASPQHIALLRLDTDFFDSTLIELETLYHRVIPGGVIILDDYGTWAGQKKAVDQFVETLDVRPMLIRTSQNERVIIKCE